METWLTIGELAKRSGVASSALRFYESKGLIASERTDGNQRRYPRATLRRVALIRAGQRVGLSLAAVASALAHLPHDQTATREDWERLSTSWRDDLDQRIGDLVALRDRLTGCIGCGCLSLTTCQMVNPGDRAGHQGPGPRYLSGHR